MVDNTSNWQLEKWQTICSYCFNGWFLDMQTFYGCKKCNRSIKGKETEEEHKEQRAQKRIVNRNWQKRDRNKDKGRKEERKWTEGKEKVIHAEFTGTSLSKLNKEVNCKLFPIPYNLGSWLCLYHPQGTPELKLPWWTVHSKAEPIHYYNLLYS